MEQLQQGIGSLQVTENDIVSSSIGLFTPPSKEVSMTRGGTVGIRPRSSDEPGPFVFNIPDMGDKFIALNQTRLYMKIRVKKSDKTDLAEADKVSIVNMFGNSFQNSVKISINNNEIASLGNTYMHYKSYAETVLSYGRDARTSHLNASRFHPDSPGNFDTIGNGNEGYLEREKWIKGSNEVEVMCPIHSDFMQMDRLFPPGHTVQLEIIRNPDSMILLSNDTSGKYKVFITDMVLYVKYVQLQSEITENIKARMKVEPIYFPFNKTIVTRHAFATGLSTASMYNLISGTVPKTLLFGMTSENADDAYNKNPYNFQHFDLESINLQCKGEDIPSERYALDFENDRYMRLFRDFYDNIGIQHDDTGLVVNYANYKKGYCFIPFDLSPDGCNGFHWHMLKTSGTLNAELRFKKALSNAIAVYVMASYDAVLEINPKKKEPVVNYDIEQ
jgi:hypothetical protein